VKTEAAFILGLRDARFTLSDREDVELTIAGSFRSLGIVETAVPVPHWTFSARTREEKAVLFALRMTVVEHNRGKRVTHEVLQDIITGYEEHLPFAREMLTNMERMTTAEREAFIAGDSSRDSKKLEPFPRWDPR
jgi:hypothetical protein